MTATSDLVTALRRAAEAENKLERIAALHQRASDSSNGPDYCDGCSRAAQEWVTWPCPTASVLEES